MKNMNTPKAWNRPILGAAAVALFGTAGYLAVNSDASREIEKNRTTSGVSPRGSDPDLLLHGLPGVANADGKSLGIPNAASGGRAAAVRVVFEAAEPAHGSPILAAGTNPDADKGRVVKLNAVALQKWKNISQGEKISIPSVSGEALEGEVNLVRQDGNWLRLGGSLLGGRGSFIFNTDFNEVTGLVLMPEAGIGYQIQMDSGAVVLVEKRLSSLLCFAGTNPAAVAASSDGLARNRVASARIAPILNTRPGAKGVIYVDFDGETVSDPFWTSGSAINAAPSTLTSEQITEVVGLVAQDYAPFDVTVTTDAALYAATPAGLRMHVVITPTDDAAPGAGGVAYINSWSGAGKGFSSDVVCWVFNQSVKGVAEALSHEVGHTLGLYHDGQTNGTEYYSGHGGGLTASTSWAPIMGVGYYRSLVQWSKGEYVLANNTEDDLVAIGRSANKFGLIQGDLPNGVKNLSLVGNTFQNEGLIRNADSVDIYKFTTSGGQFVATAQPSASETDLDLSLELSDNSGATLQLSDLPSALSAVVNKSLAAGSYQLKVRSAGTGGIPVGGYSTGYSSYGSVGRYVLSGSLEGGSSVPVFTSPGNVTAAVGARLSYSIGVSGGATVSVISSVLPAGLSFDANSLLLSGTPTVATGTGSAGTPDGPGLLKLKATNASGSATADYVINVSKAGTPLAEAFPGGSVSTSPTAPWSAISVMRADGVIGTVAQSGLIANRGSTKVTFDYTVPGASNTKAATLLTFYWKASTERLGNGNRSGDFVQCLVNGRLASDADSGKALMLSGETGWVKQSVRIQGAGAQRVEFLYTKDASLSAGQDKVWVYATSIGQAPVVVSQPTSLKLPEGTTSFTLKAEVSGADTIVWKKDFATLGDGATATGSVVMGAKTATLNLTNIGAGDMGRYWLEARNAFGGVATSSVLVAVSAPPVVTQQPVAPVALKVGDPLTLTVNVGGATPMTYRWFKDGVAMASKKSDTGAISYTLARTTASAAGTYKVSVVNQFGTVTSNEITVSFSAGALKAAR